jgi:hypothetical protein
VDPEAPVPPEALTDPSKTNVQRIVVTDPTEVHPAVAKAKAGQTALEKEQDSVGSNDHPTDWSGQTVTNGVLDRQPTCPVCGVAGESYGGLMTHPGAHASEEQAEASTEG